MKHPRPWRIESDWLVEVTDANDQIVEKFQTREEAQAFIDRGPFGHAWIKTRNFVVYWYMRVTGIG